MKQYEIHDFTAVQHAAAPYQSHSKLRYTSSGLRYLSALRRILRYARHSGTGLTFTESKTSFRPSRVCLDVCSYTSTASGLASLDGSRKDLVERFSFGFYTQTGASCFPLTHQI